MILTVFCTLPCLSGFVLSVFVPIVASQSWRCCLPGEIQQSVAWQNKMGSCKMPTIWISHINLMILLYKNKFWRNVWLASWACLSKLFTHLMIQSDMWQDFFCLWPTPMKGFRFLNTTVNCAVLICPYLSLETKVFSFKSIWNLMCFIRKQKNHASSWRGKKQTSGVWI